MYIKQVTSKIKDVFLGEGWYNWARFENIKGTWRNTSSNIRLDEKTTRDIISKLSRSK